MKMTRQWAMPNRWTFKIKPIKELIERYYVPEDCWLNPFSGDSEYGITNDLVSELGEFSLEATDFLEYFRNEKNVFGVLYDPPYSPRQVSEVYKKHGLTVNMETTQASYWKKHKDIIAEMLMEGGYCISFGWNSMGIGKTRGFEIVEILLVAHGGNHNDTIVTVERKLSKDDHVEKQGR